MEPYEFQRKAIDSIWDYFGKGNSGNPLIAMPTGTGKSIVIACFLKEVLQKYPFQKILVLTHRKELIQQDFEELLEVWEFAPAGIYSSGLGFRQVGFPITFCGIGSVFKRAELFGKIDLVIIDEAHLISPNQETMYRRFLKGLIGINSRLKIIGLTATYWRLGHGLLTENHIFTDMVYNICDLKSFNWLIDNGYLAPLKPFKTKIEIDISSIPLVGMELNNRHLQIAANKEEITRLAVTEMIDRAFEREHWIIFTTGIEHTECVAAMLNEFGVSTTFVHSKLADEIRDANIQDFKSGKYTAIVNNVILTTGFNYRPVDFIGVLTATNSSNKWVQMLGRGTRVFDGKTDCLVADFGGNTRRLGPINDPVIPKGNKSKSGGIAPVRVCPNCLLYVHISKQICDCGYEFGQVVKINGTGSTEELMRKTKQPDTFEIPIKMVTYGIHKKEGKPSSLVVSYVADNLSVFKEYIHFELPGWPRRKAQRWWHNRSALPVPKNAQEAMNSIRSFKSPIKIKIETKGKFHEIIDHFFVTS